MSGLEAPSLRTQLIGLFATNEGDEAMLNELADAIEAEARAEGFAAGYAENGVAIDVIAAYRKQWEADCGCKP